MNTQEAIEILNEYMLRDTEIGEAIHHAIEHMKRAQWMPIDSAPMCEDVDLWSKYGRYVRCQHDDYGHWFIWSDEFNQYVTLSPSIKPTHWKPLDEPPQESTTKLPFQAEPSKD